TTYFLTEISLPATNHLHRRIAATEIQKNTADSMTLATRRMRRRTEPMVTAARTALRATAPRTAEEARLEEMRRGVPWQRWGPYVSERQWGTVREDYSEQGTAWE